MEVIQDLKLEDVIAFKDKLLSRLIVDALAHGNILKNEAIALAKIVSER